MICNELKLEFKSGRIVVSNTSNRLLGLIKIEINHPVTVLATKKEFSERPSYAMRRITEVLRIEKELRPFENYECYTGELNKPVKVRVLIKSGFTYNYCEYDIM